MSIRRLGLWMSLRAHLRSWTGLLTYDSELKAAQDCRTPGRFAFFNAHSNSRQRCGVRQSCAALLRNLEPIKPLPKLKCALAVLIALVAASSSVIADTNRYETGFATLERIARDLHRALPVEKRRDLAPTPTLLETVRTPYLQPTDRLGVSNNLRGFQISQAMIEVLNYVSHARAVDQVDSGFFEKAVKSLAAEDGKALEQPSHTNAWAFNTMNWQMSHFNQMGAGLTAIHMAHHYLGHYAKYAAQLGDNKNVPLYAVLTPKEWREAVLAGSRHALDCGLAPEGLIVLYDAISRMPQRPAWAIHIMPAASEISILRLELNRVEASFFDVRTAVRDELKWSW